MRKFPFVSSGADTAATRKAGLTALGCAVVCYGCLWPVTRIAVQHMPPIWFAVVRLGTGAAIIFAILAATGRLRVPPRHDLPLLLNVGVLMVGVFAMLINSGLQFVETGRGALLSYTTPIWVTPAAALLLGERVTRARLLGLALALSGLAVLFNPASFDWSDRPVVIGNAMMVLAAMVWSVGILHLRAHRPVLTTLQLVPWQLGVAAAVCLTGALWLEGPPDFAWTPEVVAVLAYGGPVGTAAAFWGVASTFRLLPPVTGTVGMLGAPVVALVIAAAFMGEPVTPALAAGLVLILGGIALVTVATR